MTTNIKLIHSKEKQSFKVTKDGESISVPFTYSNDMAEVEQLAKATAFDVICESISGGESINVSYIVF